MMTLALPSKGRLKEDCLSLLERAGLTVEMTGNSRSYKGRLSGPLEADVAFLSASEIARELARGTVDVGVTGLDLVQESVPAWADKVSVKLELGFGHADVIVAVPDCWHDVRTMEDLHDVADGFRALHGRRLRIATKYWRLTQDFFTRQHGIQVYRIVESLGATEGAPASGAADIIVDITSTGSTIAANRLRVLDDGVILKSQACLVAAKASTARAEISALVDRITASRLQV